LFQASVDAIQFHVRRERQKLAGNASPGAVVALPQGATPMGPTILTPERNGTPVAPVVETDADIIEPGRNALRAKKALGSFIEAEKKTGRGLTDKAAYEYIKYHGSESYAEDNLPSLSTWSRYVRLGRKATDQRKNTMRQSRETGSSVVRIDQIEQSGRNRIPDQI
jgi:hypothetical protein